MAIKTPASLKSFFEAGDVPTETQYIHLIDSTYSGEIGAAIVSAAAVSAGVIKITNASSVTILDSATAGEALLAANTPASARTVLEAGSAGQAVWLADTAASAQTAIDVTAASITKAGLIEIATTAEATGGTDTDRAITPATQVAASDFVVLQSGTVSNAASLDITDLPTDYRCFKVYFDDLLPATDSASFNLLLSNDNGVSFITAAASYAWSLTIAASNTPSTTPAGGNSTTTISLATGGGNVAGEQGAGEITILNPRSATGYTRVTSHVNYRSGGVPTENFSAVGGGSRLAAEDNDAFRLAYNTGNIVSMNWTLVGVRSS